MNRDKKIGLSLAFIMLLIFIVLFKYGIDDTKRSWACVKPIAEKYCQETGGQLNNYNLQTFDCMINRTISPTKYFTDEEKNQCDNQKININIGGN